MSVAVKVPVCASLHVQRLVFSVEPLVAETLERKIL